METVEVRNIITNKLAEWWRKSLLITCREMTPLRISTETSVEIAVVMYLTPS